MNEKLLLNGEWKIKGISPDNNKTISINGTVPGLVHTALEENNYIKDLFWRDNDKNYTWVEDWSWSYEKNFEFIKKNKNIKYFLNFDGIDTYSEITLNGEVIGKTDNMFISHKYDVSDLLKDGENTINVKFFSYKPFVEGKDFEKYTACFSSERTFVRRIQCTFYWDWVARFITYGLWRDVYISCIEQGEIDDLYIYTHSISDGFATECIEIETTKHTEDNLYIYVEVLSPASELVWNRKMRLYSDKIMLQANIRRPELWWPSGYGEQPIYTLKVTMSDSCGNVVSEKQTTFGIRTAKLVQLVDEPGSREEERTEAVRKWLKDIGSSSGCDDNEPGIGYTVYINDTPVFCSGGNWVPADPFPSAITTEKYDRLVKLAKDGNFNTLRVWGGGIYESDAFYDACNRYGILVLQDFMMACGVYPYDVDEFIDKMKIEAEYAVKKLRNNPSIILWYGDNENDMMMDYDDPDIKSRNIWNKALLPALEKYEKSRPFFPSCPYDGRNKLSLTIGDTHFCPITENYLNRDFKDYLQSVNYTGRFMSEYALSGSPNIKTLLKFMNYEDLFDNEMYEYHTKDNPYTPEGTPSLFEQTQHLADVFLGKWENVEDRVKKLEYIHYILARAGVEGARRNSFYTSGILFWMYNDCWPASGWSMVDYYQVPKAGYYGFKEASKPVICSMNNNGKELEVYVCNDTLRDIEGTLNLRVMSFDGKVLYSKLSDVKNQKNTTEIVTKIGLDELPELDKNVIVVCDACGNFEASRAYYYAAMPLEMPLEKANVTMEIDKNKITVRTDKYARCVDLYSGGSFSENYFDLLPGEEKTITFNGESDVTITWLNR